MSQRVLIFLVIILFVLLLVCRGDKSGGNYIGGDETTGGKDANGFYYSKGEKLDKLKLSGAGILKGSEVTGDLSVNGSLEMRAGKVKGKTEISGNMDISSSEMGDVKLSGSGNFFKSKAKKLTLCGKLKAKGSEIDELIIDEKCALAGVDKPYVRLKGTKVGKITVPKGEKVDDLVEQK